MAIEKRLIDANEIEDLFYKQVEYGATDLMDAFDDALQDAQTVDAVEVVHGRWENVKETEVYSPDHRCTFTHTAKTCSVCNIRIGFIGADFYLYDAYCPNCGAKMGGDGNG